MARRCCCLPAMSCCRTALATVGAWLGTCRPAWLFSSSEPIAFRIRPPASWRSILVAARERRLSERLCGRVANYGSAPGGLVLDRRAEPDSAQTTLSGLIHCASCNQMAGPGPSSLHAPAASASAIPDRQGRAGADCRGEWPAELHDRVERRVLWCWLAPWFGVFSTLADRR